MIAETVRRSSFGETEILERREATEPDAAPPSAETVHSQKSALGGIHLAARFAAMETALLDAALRGPVKVPETASEDEVPEGMMAVHFDAEQFRQSIINSVSGRLESFLGHPPPIENTADGWQRLGRIDVTKTVNYGSGEKDHYVFNFVREVGAKSSQYSITDARSGAGMTMSFTPAWGETQPERGELMDTTA